MSGNKLLSLVVLELCVNAFVFGLDRHQTIQVPPVAADSVVTYRHEFDAASGQSNIVFSEVENGESKDIIKVRYSGNFHVEETNNGQVIFFLRYQKHHSDEHELWRYDAKRGVIEYISNVTGAYSVSEDGTIVAYVIFRGYDVPNTDIEFFDIQENSVLKVLNGEEEIGKRYATLDEYEYFEAYVEFDVKSQAFILTMDDWNEGGPKTFSLYVTISELRGK